MWVHIASTSIIRATFMPDVLPAATFLIYPSLDRALSYAGLHTPVVG